jgi:hypothetical protein
LPDHLANGLPELLRVLKCGSPKDKTAVVISIEELMGNNTGNINFSVIDNFKADSLSVALLDMIVPDTFIQTYKHRSYEALKENLPISIPEL